MPFTSKPWYFMRIDAQNDRLARIEDTVSQQQQQIDFVVHANEKPKEPQ